MEPETGGAGGLEDPGAEPPASLTLWPLLRGPWGREPWALDSSMGPALEEMTAGASLTAHAGASDLLQA